MAAQGSQHTFGLLGAKLGHSWSKPIHERLGSAPYDYFERDEAGARELIGRGLWSGINVTIPYKLLAAELADEKSPRVAAVGAANTLVKRSDGTVFAENTDILGFEWALSRFFKRELVCSAREALAGKKVLVLGTGGASAAVVHALRESFSARVQTISRTGSESYEGMEERHKDAVLIVNATPKGMYPNCPESPLKPGQLESFTQLKAVFDLIYNPLATKLILDAQACGIPGENGLSMLVAQAFFASELFQGTELDEQAIDEIEGELARDMRNVVLIGMPGCGKTGAGKRLARLCKRPFVDLDDVVEQIAGRSPAQIIQEDGVEAFRAIETQAAEGYCSRSGLVIACGGGIVTVPGNRDILKQNATVVFIDRALDELSTKGRPLSQASGVEKLAEERMWLYRSWADVTLPCTGSAQGDARAIKELLSL